jgi:toxin-antitoxin system PIN domain toxin
MIAVDTNVLVYAHKRDSPWFEQAYSIVSQLVQSPDRWAIAWPCVHEFLAVVTNPRIYRPASTVDEALRQVGYWIESPSLRLIGELEGHWAELAGILKAAKVHGPAIHDARIAAICIEHGVREFWTADRDFSRFPSLKTVNPLVRR